MNQEALELKQELVGKFQAIFRGWTTPTENDDGRVINSFDWRHVMHSVIPSEIDASIEKYLPIIQQQTILKDAPSIAIKLRKTAAELLQTDIVCEEKICGLLNVICHTLWNLDITKIIKEEDLWNT